MIERFHFETSDGETLEGRWDSPTDPKGAVLFCHPHPLQGGTMMAPLMIGVTTRLTERGLAVFRFNFRGIGASTGAHDDGRAELLDIDAAYRLMIERGLPAFLGGWSFGAAISLRWLSDQQQPPPYCGIAPPPLRLPEDLPPGPKRIIVGTRDQVIDTAELIQYAQSRSIDVVLTPGDHFFHGRGDKIGDLVAQGFE